MTTLSHLTEPGVLWNLQTRYRVDDIYTYTGSILIAVNPFCPLPHLYGRHMMEQAGQEEWAGCGGWWACGWVVGVRLGCGRAAVFVRGHARLGTGARQGPSRRPRPPPAPARRTSTPTFPSPS